MRGRLYWVAVGVLAVALVVWWRHSRTTSMPAGPTPTATSGSAGTRASTRRPAVAAVHIAGTVLLDGVPAPAAVVRAVPAGSVTAETNAPTDAQGRFDVAVVRGGRYVIAAELPGATGAAALIDPRDPGQDPAHVTLMLHGCVASLHGAVRDASGGPIAKARIAIASEDGETAGAGVDASDGGAFELCVSPGDVLVIVTADGYANAQAWMQVAGRLRHDFVLVPEAPIAGRVVRSADHAPVPGAEVDVFAQSTAAGPVARLRSVSDDDGRFHVSGAASGRYDVSARADHLVSVQPATVIARIGVASEVEVEVEPSVEVTGTVKLGGRGVTGAHVRLARGTDRMSSVEAEATTTADGSFRIEHVDDGDYRASVENYTSDPPPIHVASADVTGVTIDVTAMASISGRVTHDGKPVDGATVRIDQTVTTTSDATGHYTLRGLEAGHYGVYAESKRLGVFTPGPEVDVAAAEQKTGVDVEMNLAGSISGILVDQDGSPVSEATVSFSLLHGADWSSATTAEDGTFTATTLSGGGAYVYEVRPRSGTRTPYAPAEGKRFPPITVRDGSTRVTGVRIRVRRERASIAGHVVSATGQPVPDVVVRAGNDPTQAFAMASRISDATGAFAFTDLAPGTYAIRASSPDGEELVENVATGRSDVVVRLRPPGRIEGTLEGFPHRPFVFAVKRGLVDASYHATVRGDHFAIADVSPGTYAVSAMSDDGKTHADVTVESGATATLVLRNPGVGAIAGHVVDGATHAPLEGFDCRSMARAEPVVSDASGAFRLEHVAAGTVGVFCVSGDAMAIGRATVSPGQTATVEVIVQSRSPRRSYAGLELEQQFTDVIIKSVAPGGPAEAAGVAAGDVVTGVNDSPVYSVYSVLDTIEAKAPGTVVTLRLERGDSTEVVKLTLAPAAAGATAP